MWTPSSIIAESIADLNLASDLFRLLPEAKSLAIYARVVSQFLTDFDALHWWESLKLPSQSWKPSSDASRHLLEIVPDPNELIWFIPHDDPEIPVFETTSSTAVRVIAECAAFEYAICNMSLNWLIIESDHDCLFAIGDTVIEKMSRLAGLAE